MENSSKPLPQAEEVPADGFLIETHPNSTPDNLGRQRFTIYWRDSYLPPEGVRGQVCFAVLSQKTTAWDANGVKWSTWGGTR